MIFLKHKSLLSLLPCLDTFSGLIIKCKFSMAFKASCHPRACTLNSPNYLPTCLLPSISVTAFPRFFLPGQFLTIFQQLAQVAPPLGSLSCPLSLVRAPNLGMHSSFACFVTPATILLFVSLIHSVPGGQQLCLPLKALHWLGQEGGS